jgi:hypothetical protein
MPESGEQSRVVFALIVTEPASECVCVEGGMVASALPPPTSMFRNNLFKDDSALFSRFLRGQKYGLETPLPPPDLSTAPIFICMGCKQSIMTEDLILFLVEIIFLTNL